MKKIRLIFFGNEQLAQGLENPATPIFDALNSDRNYEICAIILPKNPENSANKSRKNQKLKIISRATENKIPVIFADEEKNLDETLRKFHAEIGILASFGRIVKSSTIDVFPRGILNLHPSLLPKYRGSTPIESAIIGGDAETGISLMNLVAKMDAGGIFAQEKIAISAEISKQELYEKLAILGAKMLIENLPGILRGEISARAQDENFATFTRQLSKNSGVLNPILETANEIERKIRAFLNFPKTRIPEKFLLENSAKNSQNESEISDFSREIIITKAKVLKNFAGENWPDILECAGETYLQIEKIVSPKSGKEMTFAEFLRGLRK